MLQSSELRGPVPGGTKLVTVDEVTIISSDRQVKLEAASIGLEIVRDVIIERLEVSGSSW